MKQKVWIAVLSALFVLPLIGLAQDAAVPPLETAPVAEAAAEPAKVDTGDNAWMLTSAALVLMMTAPGLALFYGGLVRQKNVLSTIMHSMFLMGLMSLLWAVYGYSMAFGDGNAFFGNFSQYFLLQGVGGDPNTDYAATIPHQTFMVFQMMFAIITPALISGAYAERIKFSGMVLSPFSGPPSSTSLSRTWSGARAGFSTGSSMPRFPLLISRAAPWFISALA
jgi:ammonium transporter, Amt family